MTGPLQPGVRARPLQTGAVSSRCPLPLPPGFPVCPQRDCRIPRRKEGRQGVVHPSLKGLSLIILAQRRKLAQSGSRTCPRPQPWGLVLPWLAPGWVLLPGRSPALGSLSSAREALCCVPWSQWQGLTGEMRRLEAEAAACLPLSETVPGKSPIQPVLGLPGPGTGSMVVFRGHGLCVWGSGCPCLLPLPGCVTLPARLPSESP